jgi:hypothetical protein
VSAPTCHAERSEASEVTNAPVWHAWMLRCAPHDMSALLFHQCLHDGNGQSVSTRTITKKRAPLCFSKEQLHKDNGETKSSIGFFPDKISVD